MIEHLLIASKVNASIADRLQAIGPSTGPSYISIDSMIYPYDTTDMHTSGQASLVIIYAYL